MEEEFKKTGGSCPKLLDFMASKEKDWILKDSQEEKKLQLKLGPPGDDEEHSVLSLGCVPKAFKSTKRVFLDTVESKIAGTLERKASFSSLVNNTNSSQARTSSVPVVGWPPIRSFRKNLASSSLKRTVVADNGGFETGKNAEICKKGLFVKINMDGIPIGRKVDLKAYDSYEKLSSVVAELFQGLFAAQNDHANGGSQANDEQKEAFTGLLDGTGEYTLVYEDNEGDRMLVGDVPWEMFVSSAKRLRVLKSSDLAMLTSAEKEQQPNAEFGERTELPISVELIN